MSKIQIGEWMWRFLAAAMLFAACWAVWIIYQLNPQPPLILSAAFEAAAKAKAKANANANDKRGEKQSVHGVIAPAAGARQLANAAGESPKSSDESPKVADAAPAAATPAAAAPPTLEAPKEAPINPEKLRFSYTIALPDLNAKQ